MDTRLVLRQLLVSIIRQYPDGWTGAAKHLGLPSSSALENRVYERRGQFLDAPSCIHLQNGVGSKVFAAAVAKMSGGVFVPLPQFETVDNTELLDLFNKLYSELGRLSATFSEAIADNSIDHHERQALTEISHLIHAKLQQLVSVAFLIYCDPEVEPERHGAVVAGEQGVGVL